MKTVFSSNLQLAKTWAAQNQSFAKGPSMLFHFQTLYSYGEHFELAKFVKAPKGETVVFINDNFYSMTTRKHLGIALSVIPENVFYFKIPFSISSIYSRSDYFKISDLPNIIKVMKNKVVTTLKRQSLAKSKTFHFDDALRQIDQINMICKMFDLPLIDRETILYYNEAKERVNKINGRQIDKGAEMVNSLYEYFGG
jgi:hypothetical protein